MSCSNMNKCCIPIIPGNCQSPPQGCCPSPCCPPSFCPMPCCPPSFCSMPCCPQPCYPPSCCPSPCYPPSCCPSPCCPPPCCPSPCFPPCRTPSCPVTITSEMHCTPRAQPIVFQAKVPPTYAWMCPRTVSMCGCMQF